MKAEKFQFDESHSTTGLNGYDPVAYFTTGDAARGSGHHVTVFDGVTYLFSSEENKKSFDAQPERYLPAYGGFCAYGASVGKKFVGDPQVWKIVGGKLYLALDRDIQSLWLQDIPGHVRQADTNWIRIKSIPPAQL